MRLIQRVGEISAGERRYARRWSAACILGGVALLLAMASAAPAGAVGTTTGTGRIAVTGIHPTGYVGLLARNGLSRDILLDYRQTYADSSATRSYPPMLPGDPHR